MQTVSEVRRENLERLVAETRSLDQVAARVNSSPIYLSQIRNQTPDAKTGRPRTMGSAIARRLEAAFGKQEGWMDQHHPFAGEPPRAYAVTRDFSHGAVGAEVSRGSAVPVIGTLQMDSASEFTLLTGPDGEAIGAVPAYAVASGMFAVRIEGDNLYPAVRHGACIIIDPAGRCESGELTFVEMTEDHFIVAELVAHRADSLTVAPVQGSGRTTYAASEVVRVHPVVSVVAGSQFRPASNA